MLAASASTGSRMTGLRYSANLSLLWPDRDPYDRFAAAAAAGFARVEMHFPQRLDVDRIAGLLMASGLELALFDLTAGAWDEGERGLAALPDRVAEFRAHAVRDIATAAALGTGVLTVLAGRPAPGTDPAACDRTLVGNLRFLAGAAAEHGAVLALEALNTVDVPGYHVVSVDHAAALVAEVDHPAVRVQFDQYHVVMMGGDPLALLDAHLSRIGHVQIADAPGRHEPGTGTAPVRAFLDHLDRLSYDGNVGLEYLPLGDTDNGLGWLPRPLRGGR
jgi:hydroxypyruvate isomerase